MAWIVGVELGSRALHVLCNFLISTVVDLYVIFKGNTSPYFSESFLFFSSSDSQIARQMEIFRQQYDRNSGHMSLISS